MTFSHWQKRAMEGMLQALEPRVNLERGAALSPRLLTLLEKEAVMIREQASEKVSMKLSKRLQKIQILEKEQQQT
jgi:hypothetical protein